MNYYTKNRFYERFNDWLIANKQPPTLLELLNYFDNAKNSEKIDKEEFINIAERRIIILKGEGFWEEENN